MQGGVSIHAPAWGATPAEGSHIPHRGVSIHAPAWGATHRGIGGVSIPCRFQSTHPRGVRRYQNRYDEYRWHVSIHAPAWGATLPPPARPPAGTGFNPRTRVGCDLHGKKSPSSKGTFQSTHPRGVRPRSRPAADPRGDRFNPRTRVGCDIVCVFVRAEADHVSIHAPAWGATRGSYPLP